MNTKITRRIAIGTILAGLASGPFIMYYVRKARQNQLFDFGAFDRFAVPFDRIHSDLTQTEVEQAFSQFFDERAMWLRFRNISARVTFQVDKYDEILPPLRKFSTDWIISFKLHQIYPENSLDFFPWEYELIISDPDTKSQLWTSVFNKNSRRLVKQEARSKLSDTEKKMFQIASKRFFDMLPLPLEVFRSLPNFKILGMLGLWDLTKNKNDDPVGNFFKLGPNNVETGNGEKASGITFQDGHFHEFTGKRLDGVPFPIFTLCNHIEFETFFYPSQIIYRLDGNGKKLEPDGDVRTAIHLADVQINTVT